MSKSNGWTLVEAVVVLAVLVTLTGILLPSVSAARDRARLVSCAGTMHDIHQALITHAMANEFRLPPFSISDLSRSDIVQSGHWGGTSQQWDPAFYVYAGVLVIGACCWLAVDANKKIPDVEPAA